MCMCVCMCVCVGGSAAVRIREYGLLAYLCAGSKVFLVVNNIKLCTSFRYHKGQSVIKWAMVNHGFGGTT